jgi:hypothetical protein
MYCSNCGVAVAQGLSYCNYCGAKLSRGKDDRVKSSQPKPEMLVAAMVFLFVFGLGAITLLMGMMKGGLELNNGVVLAFTLLSFLIMLSIEGVLMRLLFRRTHGTEEADDTARLKGQATKQLEAVQGRVLPEHMSSVTEHTTRAFDPIYNERTSK